MGIAGDIALLADCPPDTTCRGTANGMAHASNSSTQDGEAKGQVFKVIVTYLVGLRPFWAAREPVYKKKKKTKSLLITLCCWKYHIHHNDL